MNRRSFLQTSGIALPSLLLPQLLSCSTDKEIQTAFDLDQFLRSLLEVKEPSVDRIIIGDPTTPIKKIGTAWTPYWKSLKAAVAQGVNVLVTHEPTFYSHWDLQNEKSDYLAAPETARSAYLAQIEQKSKWIEDNGLVIIRCHDVIDKIKEFGIPFGLGQALGFTNKDIIRSRDYYNVYGIPPTRAIDVAKSIAQYLQVLGQPGVGFYGDEAYMVESVGVGTGCICDPMEFADLKADLSIAVDDTIRTWVQTTYSEDTGLPLITINHGTAEEYGMRLLSNFLIEALPEYEFVHINQGCSYKWVTAPEEETPTNDPE